MTWKDQGWGNRKGKVKVALMRQGSEIASETLFSEAAPHALETRNRTLKDEDLVKMAKVGDTYALFHVVGGGGGGHKIELNLFRISTKIEGPPVEKTIPRAARVPVEKLPLRKIKSHPKKVNKLHGQSGQGKRSVSLSIKKLVEPPACRHKYCK